MLDLTNIAMHELDLLVEKYLPVLNEIHTGDKNLDIYQCAYAIDIVVSYIQKSHATINADIKSWTVIAIIKLLKHDKINCSNDVTQYVDEFIDYWNSNYDNYIKQYTIYSSEFERDHGLVVKFVNNYN